MKKIKLVIIFLILMIFSVDNVIASEKTCSTWGNKGASVCNSKTYQGYKCKWDGNRKGAARCYKSSVLANEIKVNITSCTQITDSSTCQSSKVNGEECIWRQGACRNNESDGSNETIIADDQNDRNEQEESSTEHDNNKDINSESQYIAQDWDSLCADEGIKQAVKIVGYIIQLIRWIVPLIIIVLGMVDFGKAAISNDDKSVTKATTALIRRIVAGVVVFFIPTIILAILNVIQVTKGIEEETDTTFGACTKCLFDPYNECK